MALAGYVTVDGYFTTLKYVETLDGPQLEQALGFSKGRLAKGFLVARLADDQTIGAGDFELKASSRWSEGLIKTSGSPKSGEGIERLLGARGQDVAKLKQSVAAFFARRGPNTPAKVVPKLFHTDEMKYPDAQLLGAGIRSGVPQFYLVAKRRFIVLRDVAAS